MNYHALPPEFFDDLLTLAGNVDNARRSVAPYNDDQAAAYYLARFWTRYLTESESRLYNYGMRLYKAEAQPDSAWGKEVIAEWQSQPDDILKTQLAEGFMALKHRLRHRILECFQTGELVINRCPKCKRVLRTPLACQCLWCGHDWHE